MIRTRHVDAALRPHQERFDRALARQASLATYLAACSPALAFEEVLGELGAGGPARHRDFQRQVRDFAASYRFFFEERVLRGEALTANDLAQVPRFVFADEGAASVYRRVGMYLLELAIAVVALCAAGSWRIADVRWSEARRGE